jgi:Domain of unknown function (DUF4304)
MFILNYIIMHTFSNLKIGETNDLMREELKALALPLLKRHGWKGEKSRFRRIQNGSYQTLEFQFNKYGGSFAVNLHLVEPESDFLNIKFDNLNVISHQRLGTKKKRKTDYWFKFMQGFIIYFPIYRRTAENLVKMYELEADIIFDDLLAACK